MKNSYIIIVTSLLYTYLLYNQGAGINILLLNLFIIPSLLGFNKNMLTNKLSLLFAGSALLSSLFVFIIGHNLSVWVNILSLGLLSVNAGNNPSIAGNFIHFVFNYFLSLFHICKRAIEKINAYNKTQRFFKSNIIKYASTILVCCLFVSLYRYSNLAFNAFVLQLNLDFISIKLLFFYLMALVLMHAYFRAKKFEEFSTYENSLSSNLNQTPFSSYEVLGSTIFEPTEYKTGKLMLSVLNVLLLSVNLIDLQFLDNGILPNNIGYSEFVHQGIFSLILSLIAAIALLLWYFRGSLNFYEHKTLKILAIVWIVQNIFMVISVFI